MTVRAEVDGGGVALLTQKKSALLRVEGLAKSYTIRRGLLGSRKELVHALRGVTFELRRGETLGVVGESGSGKSTLGKTVLRLIEPSFGKIFFDGSDVTTLGERDMRPIRRRMQIVFQDPYSSLDPRMSVRDIVAEGIDLFRLARGDEREARVKDLLAKVGLDAGTMARYPSELSGGQRQRVAIARALAVGPELIVCDEPTSALDVSVQAQILNLLGDLQASENTAYLFISHDLRVVELVSHRPLVLYAGRIVEIGPSQAVTERRLHPYTRALFDASPPRPGSATPRKEKRSLKLALDPPSAAAPPSGCSFHPRCPKAEIGKCDKETPELRGLKADTAHQVACFFPG